MSRQQLTNISRSPLAAAVLATFLMWIATVASTLAAPPSGWLAIDGLIRAGGAAVDWANSGTTAYGTCANGGVDAIGTGGLFNCGRLGAGTNPPIAPTLTPAAAADPSIISAVFIVDPLASDTTTACGAGDPTTIAGTNGDPISGYKITTGSSPDKTELSNVYAVSHTRADNGHPELYFAAERIVNDGESHLDFEFLQSVIGLGAGCGTRSMTGSRTEGDLLVAVDFTVGGSLAGATVYEWHCVAEPGPQPPDGTVCDPPSTPNPPEHYEAITDPALLTAVSVVVNGLVAVDCGGWVCRDKSGASTAKVLSNDFLEGGIDLNTLGFKSCFHTFLPHTRVSAPFTAQLADFAGPIDFKSCRDPVTTSTSAPTGTGVPPGSSVTDAVAEGNGGAGFTPTGTVTFFLCQPAQVTASGCTSGGTQVGPVKTLVAGAASSDSTSATTTAGKYCWRTVYAPDANSLGVFAPATHTNATTECFSVAGVGLPNTGALPAMPDGTVVTTATFLIFPLLLLTLAWRRSRALSALVIAGLVTGASPQSVQPAPTTASSSAQPAEVERAATSLQDDRPAASVTAATPKTPVANGWRLVIPRIGVDALIEPVGLDAQGAMASPSGLDNVGWFQRGPSPGQIGDAVIAGHLGLPAQPAVFTYLHLLLPGDTLQVVWPDGRRVQFRVTTSSVVSADARPPDVFARTGPARLSLITCAGAWRQDRSTYTDRLIVTAVRIS